MTKLRKFFASSVMVMTIVVMSGLTAPMATKAAASAGDLIKKDGLSAVYYLGEDGKRYVFPNEATYKSWYSDFSGVVTVSADELASYALGGNVVVRPGTKLVKITTDPKVYAVEANGTLRQIPSEADAIALYGANWAQRVIDVADSFFTNYTIGSPLASGEVPMGTLVQKSGEGNIYYYDGSDYRLIEDEVAFLANRFQFGNVLTYNGFTASGSTITGAEATMIKTSQAGGSGTVVTGSGVTVSLNSMTPASMNIPGGSLVEFLKLNLTAANDGPVNISSIKLTAYGLSDATNIDEVTFYDNGVKVGTSKNINSDRVAIFNFSTPITVDAGTTKTLTVKAKSAVNSGSYALGIASASDITSSGATVSGSFPITGNTMSAIVATVGAITSVTDTDVSANASFGEDNVLLADFDLVLNNEENALLESISLYNGGTNSNDIVSNLKLFIDGTEVSSGSYADRYATFNLNNYEVEKGETISFEVRGDIGLTSVNDTIKLYLKESSDLVVTGKTHGFGLSITTNNFSSVLTTITLLASDFTIDMDKTATPAKDVKPGDKKVVLATLKMTSNGEDATISDIAGTNFYVTNNATTTTLLENAEMVDKSTGGVYDLTIATSSTKHELSLSEEISLVKGVTKTFEIRADILDVVPENDTFRVTLNGSALTMEGDVSGAPITNVTPSSVSGSLITVKSASLTLTPTVLNNLNIVGGSSDQVVYQAKVKAGNADGIKIQSFKLTSATSSAANSAFTDNNISQLSLYLDGKLLKTVSNGIAGDSTTTNGTITFSSLNSSYYTVPAGEEVVLEVRANFASSVTAGDFKLKVGANGDVIVRAASDNDSLTASTSATYSRVVTTATKGTLNVALVITDMKANKDSFLLAGSQTEADRYLGEIKFTTTKEPVKVTALTLTGGGTATNADIQEVKLVNAAGSVIATQTVNAGADAVFDPFDITFPADQVTSLFIVAVAKGINVDADPTSTATDGTTINYALGAITCVGANSGEDITETTTGTGTSKTATVVGSKLNTVTSALSDGNLVGGSNKVIGKYTLVFDNGSNRDTANGELKAILATTTIAVTKSTNVSVTDAKMYIEGSAANVAEATGDTGTTTSALAFSVAELANLANAGKLDGSVTLVITATVAPSTDTGEFLQTSFADLNGSGGDSITYISDGETSGTARTNMFLPVTYVDGATLSE